MGTKNGAMPRGRDVRRMKKPYTCREVFFTCSNGWTIEKLPPEDHALEGKFMGHCLGTKDSGECGLRTELSLREPDGTPHVTIGCSWTSPVGAQSTPTRLHNLGGRCNRYPKAAYVALINEYARFLEEMPLPLTSSYPTWGQDVDDEYHDDKVLTDEDYRDNERIGYQWRDAEWRVKRGVTV
jgi:hypothetical protein